LTCAILAKTDIGMEKYVANVLRVPCKKVVPAPMGFKGLILIEECEDFEKAFQVVSKVPEVIRVMKAERCVRADLNELKRVAEEMASRLKGKRFAVRTVRRGKHPFTSVQVNAELGSVVLSKVDAEVDLSDPEAVLMVEIVGDRAFVSIVPPEYYALKKKKGKVDVSEVIRKVVVVQEPYLGPLEGVKEVSKRVGRVLQSFGVGTYYAALTEEADGDQLAEFLRGVREGAESRRRQREKSEGKANRLQIKVFDMYHLVASRGKKDLVVVFEPEGKSFEEVMEDLGRALRKARRVYLVLGSRKGVPMGLYKFADFVVDVAPGAVLSTETAVAAALEAVVIAFLASQRSDVGPALPLSGSREAGEGLGPLKDQEG